MDANWDDEVFAGRNREYGAYPMRKDSNVYLMNAMFIFCLAAILAVILNSDYFKPGPNEADNDTFIYSCGFPLLDLYFEDPEARKIPQPTWEDLLGSPRTEFGLFVVKPIPDKYSFLDIEVAFLGLKPVGKNVEEVQETEQFVNWQKQLNETNFSSFIKKIAFDESGDIRNQNGYMKVFVRVDKQGNYLYHYPGYYEADHEFRDEIHQKLPQFDVFIPQNLPLFQGAELHLLIQYNASYL